MYLTDETIAREKRVAFEALYFIISRFTDSFSKRRVKKIAIGNTRQKNA